VLHWNLFFGLTKTQKTNQLFVALFNSPARGSGRSPRPSTLLRLTSFAQNDIIKKSQRI
jgi:hypothetical protein